MITNVIVKLQIEGIHKWGNCNIDEVKYLANNHRHIFHICVKKRVQDNDRQVEIICLKHKVELYMHKKFGNICNFGNMSCEMIAQELVTEFSLNYCQVLEDNENGAEVWD